MGRPCVESITRPSTSTDQYTNALCELNLSFKRVADASRAQLTAGSSFTGRGDIIMVTATSDYLLIVCTRPSSCKSSV